VYDLFRGTLTRFTAEGMTLNPIWTPDGKRLVFTSGTIGPPNLFWKPADGTSAMERLATSPQNQTPHSWSPDGQTLLFSQATGAALGTTRSDIWELSVADPSRTPRPLLQTAADELWPAFSPDGRWIAYASDQSGKSEVYVQPYPGPGERRQISVEGGSQPAWSRDGRELFFTTNPDAESRNVRLLAVDIKTTPTFTAGVPKLLPVAVRFSSPSRSYDVSSDSKHFITVRDKDPEPVPQPAQIVIVQNWTEELKRLVPTP
jgi:Tol biopolymer transport system component